MKTERRARTTKPPYDSDRLSVVIAGGGVAGLEAMLALRSLAADLVDIELLSPAEEFVFRPLLVAEPFGAGGAARIPLERVAADLGAHHRRDSLTRVDPAEGAVITASEERLEYGALLIAVGAQPVEAVSGALTFSGQTERERLADLLAAFGRRGTQSLAFVVPRGVTWAIAAYELALLTAAERDARRLSGVEITLITHETAPLGLFGAGASQLVAATLEEAGIRVRLDAVVERFTEGRLLLTGGETIAVDAAVALPGLRLPPFPGLPQRAGGFVETDVRMQVSGLENVWAAGDATSFPIKQGGLATQQADVAARSIAARAGAHVPVEAFQPVLRAALITGGAPEFLRASLSGRESGVAVAGQALWAPATKVAGKHLGSYLETVMGLPPDQRQSPGELADLPDDVASSEPSHEDALELLLAAADADAKHGDFEGALRWLEVVEQLDFVIPSDYVVRRDEWGRQIETEAEPGPAAKRLDPALAGPSAAISDLERRVGWLREIERRTEASMGDGLSHLEGQIQGLTELSRRAGILERRRRQPR